ncbi:uncharacterized protein [Triticum aestivum]|uniref:uncharacterized protein n=1 Tax=Triticum aestivum TaxID=4565 RepID=UPI001D00ED1C|nr:uncharacterized protein LOC123162992 [Triticum aestivum]XP_044436680.1 uncharacterized protein LOC123162992 [Triticum aestivum]
MRTDSARSPTTSSEESWSASTCARWSAPAQSPRGGGTSPTCSRACINVRHFVGDNSAVLITGNSPMADVMEAFTGALCSLLSACPPPAQCKCAIKTLSLRFFPMSDLSSIGRAVEDAVARGEIECLEFHTCSPYSLRTGFNTEGLRAELGQLFMSFSRACPVTFRWLTMLKFNDLVFGHSDVTDLIRACDRLRHLTLSSCGLVDRHSVLKIDTPRSGLHELCFIGFRCR